MTDDVKKETPPKQSIKLTQELGRSGLKAWGGLVYEEFEQKLQGDRGRKVYAEMRDNDPIVGAILFAIEMLMRRAEWYVEGDAEDARTEFLDSCMRDMSHTWDDFVAEALSMLPFGWSFFEVVYKKRAGRDGEPPSASDDGLFGWRKFALRSQESLDGWCLDENGGIQGMWQQAPPDYARCFIPIDKALLFRTTAHKGNPEGRSVLRSAYKPHWFKKRIEHYEAIGVERDLAGIPKIGIPHELLDPVNPPEGAAEIVEAWKRIGENLRNDEQACIVYPLYYDEHGNKLFDVELLSTGGSRQFDTGPIIERYSRQIAMTILADVILLGHERVGSFALAEQKGDLLTVALTAWLEELAGTINKHAVTKLLRINGMELEDPPMIRYRDLEAIDLVKVADAMQKFAGAGMALFPDKDLDLFVREQAGWPERTDMEDDYEMPLTLPEPEMDEDEPAEPLTPEPAAETPAPATAAQQEEVNASLAKLEAQVKALAKVRKATLLRDDKGIVTGIEETLE